jgi:hypothetical protein
MDAPYWAGNDQLFLGDDPLMGSLQSFDFDRAWDLDWPGNSEAEDLLKLANDTMLDAEAIDSLMVLSTSEGATSAPNTPAVSVPDFLTGYTYNERQESTSDDDILFPIIDMDDDAYWIAGRVLTEEGAKLLARGLDPAHSVTPPPVEADDAELKLPVPAPLPTPATEIKMLYSDDMVPDLVALPPSTVDMKGSGDTIPKKKITLTPMLRKVKERVQKNKSTVANKLRACEPSSSPLTHHPSPDGVEAQLGGELTDSEQMYEDKGTCSRLPQSNITSIFM